jgi:O-antigen/teichoic acid export membrane protein
MSARASILIARQGVVMLLGLVTFSILTRTLSKEQFALYKLVFGFVAILRLTTLPGLGTAVTQAFARGRFGGFRRAVMLSVAGSLIGSLAMLFGAWFQFREGNAGSGTVYLSVAACFPLVAGLMYWRNAIVGMERYHRLLWFDSLSAALKSGAVIACAYFIPGALLPVVIAMLVAPGLVNVAATIEQLRTVPSDAAGEPRSIEYGVQTTIYQVPTLLAQQLDKIALFYFISPAALAAYAVALRIPELARTVVCEANATLGPLFARQSSYSGELRSFSVKLWLLYGGVSIAGALFVVPVLLPLLAGDAYAESIPYAQIMTVGAALSYLGDIQFRYVKSHLHSRSFLAITGAKAFFDCILILALAYSFGLKGVVCAYVLKNLGYTAITSTVVRAKYTKVPVPECAMQGDGQ